MKKSNNNKKTEIKDNADIFGVTLKKDDYIKVIVGRLIYYGKIKGFHINPYYVIIEDIYGQTCVLNLTKATMITKIDESTWSELRERALRRLERKRKRKSPT